MTDKDPILQEETDPETESGTAPETPGTAPRSIAATVTDYLEILVLSVAIVLLLFTFVGRVCIVTGESMNQTLQDGEGLLVLNAFYTPKRGDIVVFSQTSKENERLNEALIKRVVGLPGDTVRIDYASGTVYVNDEPVTVLDKFPDGSDSYIYLSDGTMHRRGDVELPAVVPEGHLFVMGDNRNNSMDSRYSAIGFVDQRRVLGKAVLRVAPIRAFGLLTGAVVSDAPQES